MKRRILIVSFLEPWSMGEGKGAPSLYETLRGYADAGWNVEYLTFDKRAVGGTAHECNSDPNILGVVTRRIRLPLLFHRGFGARVQAKLDRLLLFPLLMGKMIRRIVSNENFDVIYAYEISGILAVALARVAKAKRALVVHRMQGVSVLEGRWHEKAFMFRKLENLLALSVGADCYIMTNDGTYGDSAWRYWNSSVNDRALLHIRNGIAQSCDSPETGLLSSNRERSNRVVALTVSRLDPIKRVDRAISALPQILIQQPNFVLVIVGEGEDEGRLRKMVDALGVSNHVVFLGARSRDEVASLMRSCDIFLSLYDFSNCGNPLFEALLSGAAIITLNNGATGDVITHLGNGVLLSPDDEAGLKDWVVKLSADADLRAHLSAGASAWASANLQTWKARMEQEISWIESRLSSGQPT